MMKSLVVFLVVIILCSCCTAQITTDPPGPLSVEENLADILLFTGTYTWQDVGCTMKGVDGSSSILGVFVNVTHVAVPGSCNFNVTLVTPVDYEKNRSFRVDVYLRKNCAGIESVQKITKFVVVENVMDTPPVFQHSVYTASVPENHVVNTAVLVNIRAEDADDDSVTYAVNFVDQQNQVFADRRQANPEILDIYLISSLDFEQQHTYRFTITAVDSVGMNSTCDVIIKVINIQDTPPYFSALQYNGRVSEDAALGTVVLSVSAVDGDSVLLQGEWNGASANQLHYSVINGGDGMFGVNSSTGEITTITPLDIDNNTNFRNGLVVLNIMAEELNTSMEPQYGDSSSTVLVLIQIEDANDNRPQFNAQSFTGSIAADAGVGEFITLENGGYISVHDIDQAPSNNRFCLHIEHNEQPWDVFKPNIEVQYAYASVMIQLNKNDSLADLAETHIRFQIVAQECGQSFQNYAPTKSAVTVWVKARPVPPRTPDPIISLPLSTSDIIVFIVGILLLLNIGLTVFVCYALGGRRGYPMALRNKNSKYQVTSGERGIESYIQTADSDEFGNLGTSKCMIGEDNVAKMAILEESLPEQKASKNARVNDASKTRNTRQYDTKMLKDRTDMLSTDIYACVFNKKTQPKDNASFKSLTTDISASQMKPTEILILNDRSHTNHYVTTPVSSFTEDNKPFIADYATHQQTQDRSELLTLESGASEFLQDPLQNLSEQRHCDMNKRDGTSDRHHLQMAGDFDSDHSEMGRFRSNSSSFSENRSSDELPLIKSLYVKSENNYEHAQNTATSQSDINGKIKQPRKMNKNVSLQQDQSQSDCPIQESDKENKLEFYGKHKNMEQKNLPVLGKDNANLETTPTSCHPPITAQLTQTDVPPIALALPYSTGTFSVNRELHTGIVNPVYGTQAISDNQHTVPFSLVASEDRELKLASSDKNGLNMHPLSITDAHISQDSEENAFKINDSSSGVNRPDMKNESSLSGKTSLHANDFENQQTVVYQGNHTQNVAEQLYNGRQPSAQNVKNQPSPLNTPQDFMAAAKELLSTKIKNNTNNPDPPSETIIHDDVSQLQKQTSVGDNYSSF